MKVHPLGLSKVRHDAEDRFQNKISNAKFCMGTSRTFFDNATKILMTAART